MDQKLHQVKETRKIRNFERAERKAQTKHISLQQRQRGQANGVISRLIGCRRQAAVENGHCWRQNQFSTLGSRTSLPGVRSGPEKLHSAQKFADFPLLLESAGSELFSACKTLSPLMHCLVLILLAENFGRVAARPTPNGMCVRRPPTMTADDDGA